MFDLASEVVQRRKNLRLTQDELADLANCSPRFIRLIEAGKQTVQFDKLLSVFDVLGLEIRLERRDKK